MPLLSIKNLSIELLALMPRSDRIFENEVAAPLEQ
jgi:hypothetical protein